ncbi:unnamed protein product [Caenorhabditis angaria]|uniref:SAP domain-containing protein n=1 Tax=Caenorhabditis angaria TaxID=860376 RepID=A0A9P1IFT7_9PELO|nr:unnamed protein product [Caenorhabditis angaria]
MVLTVADAKKLTVARLKEELLKRGLSDAGNKPDLLARLTESIEDSILNDAGDLSLPNDDILLNDDILDAPSIDGDNDVEKLLNSSEDVVTSPTPPATTIKPIEAPEDPKLARAARFGLPVTGTASATELASESAKEARAKRFGIQNTPGAAGAEEDKKAARAARFGIETSSETKDKLAARAARFGIPVNSDGKRAAGEAKSEEELKKLEERAKRFGLIDEDADAKKKARLERFGA